MQPLTFSFLALGAERSSALGSRLTLGVAARRRTELAVVCPLLEEVGCFVPERELDPKVLFPAGTLGSCCRWRVCLRTGSQKAPSFSLAGPVRVWGKTQLLEQALDHSAALRPQEMRVTCWLCCREGT